MNRIFRNVSIASVAGIIITTVCNYFPARYAFGGNSSISYGFPFIYLNYYTMDLIGSGMTYNPYAVLADYLFWTCVTVFLLFRVNKSSFQMFRNKNDSNPRYLRHPG